MKKIIYIAGGLFFLIGMAFFGYIFLGRLISDEAIKNRVAGMLKDFGSVRLDNAHVDFLEGLSIDNLSFDGTCADLLGKSFVIPKILLKHDLQGIIKGRLNINQAIVIGPQITIEKPTDIWSLLNALKANFDKAPLPLYTGALRNGVEIRDLKVHIKENPETQSPEIKVSGINVTFVPYAGSFEDIIIKGNVADPLLGSYSLNMRLRPNVPSLDIEIGTNDIVMSEEFCQRFPYIGKMLWDSYKPSGKMKAFCRASFNNQDGQQKKDYLVTFNMNGLEIKYEKWPRRIYNMSGDIEINTEKIYLKNLVGYIKSGDYTSQAVFNGEVDLYGPKKTFILTIPNVFLKQEILQDVPEIGEYIWSKARPNGLVDVVFQYNKETEEKERYYLEVTCKGLEVKSPEMPFPISYVNGQIKLCDNIMLFKNASGYIQCGDQAVFSEMNGVYDMNSGRRIFNFHAPSLDITRSFLEHLPNKGIGEKLLTNLNPAGKVEINANFQHFKEQKDNDYSVELNLKDCDITDGKYKIPFRGVGGRVEVNKKGFSSKHIEAKCYGGHIEGTISVETETEPYLYHGEMNFSQVELKDIIQKIANSENSLSGKLSGNIVFQGKGTDTNNICADGKIQIDEGHLSDVPIVLSIFNILNLSIPKKESFRTAQINFNVKDGIVNIEEGRLYSDTVELIGRGTVKLTGDIDIKVVAGFSRDFFSEIPIVGKIFDYIVGGVRKQLTMVEINGTFLKPESRSIAFKPLTTSIRSMFDLLPKSNQDVVPEKPVIEEKPSE